MKITQLTKHTLERAEERFNESLGQMRVEEANEMPEPLWESAGWREKFALELPDDTEDWHHTPEEAAKVTVTDKNLLTEYLAASVRFTKDYLDKLEETDLEEVIDENWTASVTRQVRLVSAIDDAVMHSGQAVYTRRLVIGK